MAEPAASPLDVAGSYVSDTFSNVSGGRDRGFRQMGLLELTAEGDGAAIGADGVKAFASLQLVHGESLSGDLVGDAQVVSNIDAPDGVRLFEAWISVPIAENGYLKGGLIDLNGEFDVQTFGALFLNSSHGIGPDFSQSGLNGPSIFPTTSSAVVGGWKSRRWSARVGLFDAVSGDPDAPRRTIIRAPGATGLLVVGEADFTLGKQAELQIGAWRYTPKFEVLSTTQSFEKQRGNQGAYAMIEGQVGKLWGQRVDAWVRAGLAETRFNPIGLYLGGGVALGEDSSRWGLAVGQARLGRRAMRLADGFSKRSETSIEFTYSRAVGPRMVLQPDIQYVINPGWDRRLRNALVAGLRLRISLF